ncbi:next to BRCA1 gene 1 protein isoform X1, partial [Tachysurus ichikawai]
MDSYINLKVNFRGNTKSFLLSGSETKSWESMEATVRMRRMRRMSLYHIGLYY